MNKKMIGMIISLCLFFIISAIYILEDASKELIDYENYDVILLPDTYEIYRKRNTTFLDPITYIVYDVVRETYLESYDFDYLSEDVLAEIEKIIDSGVDIHEDFQYSYQSSDMYLVRVSQDDTLYLIISNNKLYVIEWS